MTASKHLLFFSLTILLGFSCNLKQDDSELHNTNAPITCDGDLVPCDDVPNRPKPGGSFKNMKIGPATKLCVGTKCAIATIDTDEFKFKVYATDPLIEKRSASGMFKSVGEFISFQTVSPKVFSNISQVVVENETMSQAELEKLTSELDHLSKKVAIDWGGMFWNHHWLRHRSREIPWQRSKHGRTFVGNWLWNRRP